MEHADEHKLAMQESHKRLENLALYGTTHPEVFEAFDAELPNYHLGPGATGACQLVDLQEVAHGRT